MFWKIGNKNKISLSLVNQMIMLYSIATFVIVIFVCMILFPTFEKITHINNLAYRHNLLSQCIVKLMIALLFSMVSAILFSSIISKKTMKQIHALSENIKNTTVNSLETKIETLALPKELHPLGESFNMMLDKLQNSFTQISQFSSDIAHELRNPLNNLLGINEVALTNQYTLEQHREVCESNLEECRYLLKLIENLWFIAQSEHAQLSTNKSLLNAGKEISNILNYYEPYAALHGIRLSCEGNAILYADAILFKRAISNILSNALRHTKRTGEINIEIKPTPEKITISIHDTGIGIEEKHLPNLFDRFYRVDPSRSSHTGGLGLGLPIVKSIMELHKGYIDVQSKLNIGTSVILNFPILS